MYNLSGLNHQIPRVISAGLQKYLEALAFGYLDKSESISTGVKPGIMKYPNQT